MYTRTLHASLKLSIPTCASQRRLTIPIQAPLQLLRGETLKQFKETILDDDKGKRKKPRPQVQKRKQRSYLQGVDPQDLKKWLEKMERKM